MDYVRSAEDLITYMKRIYKTSAVKDLDSISRGEMAVLEYLSNHHDGAAAGELSEVFCVGSSRIAAVLNTLEKKGFAERRTDPGDGRRVLVFITDAGRVEADRRHAETVEHISQFLRTLGDEDSAALFRIVRKAARTMKFPE